MDRKWLALALFEIALFSLMAATVTVWMLIPGAVFAAHALTKSRAYGAEAKGKHHKVTAE